jgi:hypothetical protein
MEVKVSQSGFPNGKFLIYWAVLGLFTISEGGTAEFRGSY